MKKPVLIAIIICLAGINTSLFAQQRQQTGEQRKERFEKFKVEREAYISKIMQLTDNEKTAFWTLCNEYQVKKFELNKTLREETRKLNQARKDKQTVTEANYKKVIELGIQVKAKEAQLEQEYTEKFLKVISAEKVFLYQNSEKQFGERMIRDRENNEKNENRKKRD
ncbi:hypothetical protein FACS189421_03250 [Bacteroidia bacterium]|nr:hypothetical protein FACS189421_03250 [Bacteroidia bacterium]GHT04790.1 hypothetical protein FACS189423_08000 [Bacteroidia bacterium]